MAASGYTPIITYNSSTTGHTPTTITTGELAINITDGKLFVGTGTNTYNLLVATAGTTSITTLGTVTTGTWNATTIGPTYGGTGQTTYTTGDMLYSSGSNVLSKLSIGSSNQVLTVVGGVPAWANAAASGPTKAQAIAYSMTLGF